jgi:Na+/melibiose symporter-like transporter
MERQDSRPPAGGRRVMSTGVGITLIAVGAILRFALAPGSPHGLNLHVVGVVLIVVGILGLLLSLLFAGWPRQRRLVRWSRPGEAYGSSGSSRLARRRRAAADDVAAVREDDRFYAPDTTGRQDDDL